jgi:hypothetical protein
MMANHYHLLIETPKANLPIGMRQLNAIYTTAGTTGGPLLQGRFNQFWWKGNLIS